ncbi:Eco57I restriction-modification methylase [Flavobacterium fluvii]|uniref:site-specific DNA-methyltransferase (adenine-specific) n=1 Tax=Flavobacterium fluvii TaxID=468056 RepID=A0A1M5Q0Z3_9FLAO|nr:Eco57I restriction-modification methylase domain-containing protein [Flavobacterium fluvii]SHH07566.1 Eco57I restriction-modification methylase [Flavobacterium fluvii]
MYILFILFFYIVCGGFFDIVIGNPPYVNVEKLDDLTKKYLFEKYENCKGRTDLYIAFIEQSLNLLKVNGLNNFIIPYAVTNQNYGSILRKNLVDKYFISEIVDTSEYMVFDTAIVKNVILNIQNCKNRQATKIKIVKSENDFKEGKFNLKVINQNVFLGLKNYRFETKDISKLLDLKSKIHENSIRLEQICLIAYGARLNHKTEKIGKENYIYQDFKPKYKPFTEGKNIERFIFTHNAWLDYQSDIHYNSMFPELFENEKIFFINVVKDRLRFTVIDIANKIANEITTTFGDYRGTKSFYREPVRKHFKNKKLSFSLNKGTEAETGKPTMRHDIDPKFYVDLNKADWYVFNENYGSSEEKFLVKFFESQIEELKEKYQDIYLLRNERFFKLYRYSDAKATEPDFVLFMTEKKSGEEIIYQLFIEPKGTHLLSTDSWKEDFLMGIEDEAVIELYQNQSYKLIGMPFYNKENRESVFEEKLKNI